MHSHRFVIATLLLALLACRAAPAQPVLLDLRRPQVQKDLSASFLGADGQDFTLGGVEYADLLGPRRAEFAQVIKEAGIKVFRFATMQRYDYAGAEASLQLVRAQGGRDLPYRWFDPELLFSFCKENDLRVIAMVNLPRFYDAQTGRVLDAASFPGACARNAARFVSWVKEKGFSSQVVAWELGSPPESAWCEPDVWARIHVACARAMKEADPTIRIAVPAFAIGAQWAGASTPEAKQYAEWTAFSRDSLAAAGRDARLFDYLALRLYGDDESRNANGIGPENFRRDLVRPNANLKHVRFLVTEWRFTREPDLGDQTFVRGALQHGKIVADLLADSQIDWVGGIHSLHQFGGLVYVSDGKAWHLGASPVADPLGKPRMALGPHAVVMRWLNEAIHDCPQLVDAGDTAGRFSSTKLIQEGRRITPGVQWLALMDPKGTRLHLVVINTHPTPELLDVRLPVNWTGARLVAAETYVSDDPFARFRPESDTQPWRVEALAGVRMEAGTVQGPLRPLSISRLVLQAGQP